MLNRTIATLAVATVATGAAAVGVVAGPANAVPDRAGSLPCGAVWDRLPQELRDDLAALPDLTPKERRRALTQIRHDARHGEYGDRVERFADRMAEKRADMTPAERRHLRREVLERLRDRREQCAAS